MDVYHDYTLVRGTSEGDATSDGGCRAWFCLVTDLADGSDWKLGISASPDTDILGGIVEGDFEEFFRQGRFDSPQAEMDIIKFIEAQVADYFAETEKQGANKTVLDNRLPAPSSNDLRNYNP